MGRHGGEGKRRIVVWVPDWPLASLTVSVPPEAPAVTVQNGRVRASTRAARKYKIHPGMRQTTAEQLCSELLVLPHDSERDDSSFEVILEIFDQAVAGVTGLWPGMAWAQTPRSMVSAVAEESVCAGLGEQITSQTGVEVYVGIGSGMAAAVAAARRGICVPPGRTEAFLSTLNLEELVAFIPAEARNEYAATVHLLRSLGVKKVRQLLKLGVDQLVTRFGKTGEDLWKLGVGRDLFVPQQELISTKVSARFEFDPPVGEVGHSLVGVRRVAEEFVTQMGRKGVTAESIEIGLENGHGQVKSRRWTFLDISSAPQIAQRIIWQIRSWADQIQRAESQEAEVLQAVFLQAVNPVTQASTRPLWGNASPTEKVSQSVAQVQLLLGDEAVLQPRLQGGLDPRTRVSMQPWGKAAKTFPVSGQWSGKVESAPIILFDTPPQAKLIGRGPGNSWGPVWVDSRGVLKGFPVRLVVLEGRKELSVGGYAVTDFVGLWTVNGYWWSEEVVERPFQSYLRVKLEKGADLLLRQTGQQWHVEGIYTPLVKPTFN